MSKQQAAQTARARANTQTECYVAIGLLALRMQSCANDLPASDLLQVAPQLARAILELSSAAAQLAVPDTAGGEG